MDNMIFELKNVYFSYLGKFPALNGIDIKIQKGQKISIVGANGSGKSSFLQILDGLIFADSGSVNFYGRELNEKNFNDDKFCRSFRQKVGFVFQNPDVQLFCPTVQEDIVFGPLHLGVEKKLIERRLERLVSILGLQGLLDRIPHQLSIGEKRKVAIASTLIIEPEILILDEPTAGLDPLTTRHIIDLLIDTGASGKTIITATHDLHIVEEISDIVYVFGCEKKIASFGKASCILNDMELLKANNLLHIHSHRHKDTVHVHSHRPSGQGGASSIGLDTHIDHH
ncbi:MAG: ABC transporter ATP-binding protein [Candidatus Omnitrophica bacterium]|jgi:cobalt/nickel transport system ATP-binding protein|nr:ABC transporter ATP-binding protein [Candidatus Omnitrophota bacterium]MDD5660288.1 ABC transporter ATP-binding protein [Candidatus Omnitrophota bacterium]